jgi:hypothetical protein
VEAGRPQAAAIERVLQWVAFSGVASSAGQQGRDLLFGDGAWVPLRGWS